MCVTSGGRVHLSTLSTQISLTLLPKDPAPRSFFSIHFPGTYFEHHHLPMSLGVPRAKGEAKAAWDISGLLVGNPPRTHGLAQHYPSFALHSPLLSQLSRVHV